MNEYYKHPDATIDIRCSFASDLQPNETVLRTRWLALGLTVVAEQMIADDTVTIGWIAGGLANSRYYVTCAVITSRNRTLMQDIILHVSADAPLPESQL